MAAQGGEMAAWTKLVQRCGCGKALRLGHWHWCEEATSPRGASLGV